MKSFRLLLAPLLTLLSSAETIELSQREVMKDFKTFGIPEFNEGKALYKMVCAACHGDRDTPAPVPNARSFHDQPLQNGSDPHAIYQTLTKGYNQMVPQTWMTPLQKYYLVHFIREEFFREANVSQYSAVDDKYINSLPEEKIVWPKKRTAPKKRQDFNLAEVDHGPVLFGHFEASPNNIAPKGLIIGLSGSVTGSRHHALYDLDTARLVAFNDGELLDWKDLNYNGNHRMHAKLAGELPYESPAGLAWALPGEPTPGRYPDFRDHREMADDGRKYGPLADNLVKYHGLSLEKGAPTLHYSVAGTEVFDRPSLFVQDGETLFVRSLLIAPRKETLHLRTHGKRIESRLINKGPASLINGGRINDGIIKIRPSDQPVIIHYLTGDREPLKKVKPKNLPAFEKPTVPNGKSATYFGLKSDKSSPALELTYQETSKENGFSVETAEIPQELANPWTTKIRLSGIDFLGPDTAALSSWTGDVFLLEGIRSSGDQKMRLSRIASGLHQPLGLKVRDGQIFVGCRDQIMRPHDFDGDAVADYYEAFNSDHTLTMHFHEFAGGLDTDADGNFFYIKCGQHADAGVIPRHGTLIKVSADGKKSQIIANGLRSANGCFVDHDGTVWATDQEGFWNPQNKIMRVEPDGFHGNMLGWHDPKKVSPDDDAMVQPLVWLPKSYANSPSEVFRFPTKGWGGLNGTLGYFEYGKGRIMVLPHEEKNGKLQGLAHPLAIPDFASGIMRGRFHPEDQTLHACGLFGWGSVRTTLGGLYRVKPTGDPVHCVTGFSTSPGKVTLKFSEPLAADALATDRLKLTSYVIKRSANYGSKMEDETNIPVEKIELSADGLSATIHAPELKPSRVIFFDLKLKTATGLREVRYSATIHEL